MPLSPRIKTTVLSLAATLRINCNTWRRCGLEPTMPGIVGSGLWAAGSEAGSSESAGFEFVSSSCRNRLEKVHREPPTARWRSWVCSAMMRRCCSEIFSTLVCTSLFNASIVW